MCGINGFSFEDVELINKMNKVTSNRGPDGEGIFVDKISLGQNRLAIIDLSEKGKQPMANADESVWITFNGEIYNYKEIRAELEDKYEFKSQSDTETIIHAYEEWGQDCVKKFNGMWAFCIYDKTKNILFLSRDRLGEKPLYYTQKNGLVFSSEIKAILQHGIERELNSNAVSSYLSYRYVIGEETFFKNIFKLLPGHNLIYELNSQKIKIYEYWDLIPSDNLKSESLAMGETERLLEESVNYTKISDVPIGVILSGGLDSSVIAALLAKRSDDPISTFTVKFKEENFDETPFAKKVAEIYNTKHHEVEINVDNFFSLMKEYSRYKDEPIGVPNEIALYLLSRKIKENATVVLSGEGADEIFEGYGRIFSSARDYEILKGLREMKDGKEIYEKKYSSLYSKYQGKMFESELDHFLFMYKYWPENEKNKILLPGLKKDFGSLFKKYLEKYDMPYQKKISYVFLKLHLPGLLNRLDGSSMASGVEARAPFLNYRLVQEVFNLPSELKTRWKIPNEELKELDKNCDELSEIENTPKYLLKKIAEKHLPHEIVYRKKQGFPLPLKGWFEKEFMHIAKRELLADNSHIKKIIDQRKLGEWIDENKDIKKFEQNLWMLLSLELWLREWF